jgi:hypothetical protein
MDASMQEERMPVVVPGPREDLAAWALTSRETGERVLVQVPNVTAVVSQAAAVSAVLAPPGSRLRTLAGATALVTSTWWGADELARGVNPARRALGAAGLVGALVAFAVAARRRT